LAQMGWNVATRTKDAARLASIVREAIDKGIAGALSSRNSVS